MASDNYQPTTIINELQRRNQQHTSSLLHHITMNVWLLAEKCWMPQRKKADNIADSNNGKHHHSTADANVRKTQFVNINFLSSNFLFNFPVFIAPTVWIIWSSCWVILKWLLEMFLIRRLITNYQSYCSFEWDSSTEAGNVTVNMKLDFNDFNSTVFSVYELYPLLNMFIVQVLCEVLRGCYCIILLHSLRYKIILNKHTTKLKLKTVVCGRSVSDVTQRILRSRFEVCWEASNRHNLGNFWLLLPPG